MKLMLLVLPLLVGLVQSMSVPITPSAAADLIDNRELPGLKEDIFFNQYSGYLNAGENNRFHYWLVESQTDPADSPLLLWLNGGPGCSSMDGMLSELGPLLVGDGGKTLKVNKYSWNTFANVLFIESPACVGFSYNTNGNCSASDDSVSLANYEALKDFFAKFPMYRNSPFFVTGESYGGIYVPTLSVRIVENNSTFPINFKGFAVGNGMSSWSMNDNSIIFFANYHGLLGRDMWVDLVDHCCDSDIPTQKNCHFTASKGSPSSCIRKVKQAMDIIYNSGLNMYNLYDDCKSSAKSQGFSRYHADLLLLHRNLTHDTNSLKASLDPPCTDSSAMSTWLNNQAVRKALHIVDNATEWSVCNDEVNFNFVRQYESMTQQYKKLYAAGIRGLVYNGDVDMACNFIGDQWFVESLKLPKKGLRRPWYHDNQVGGFVKRFKLLDLLTVRGSGHMVPQDKPGPSLHMIKAFVTNQDY